ncbi:MAG: LytTR family DNA-binding domain-containing protein [Syntrophomonadaceae bacterium]|nr:LytTR family DNA-binding domain-containing protein [Syntrophomonadaceae bacterium]
MSLRVVIVDDDERERIVLRYILEQLDDVKIVGEANNGLEAVLITKEKHPDLVFLDINMPELSGLETAQRIKTLHNPPLFAFVTLHPEFAVDAFDLDALDFVVKPLDATRIAETVNRAKKRLEHERLFDIRVEDKVKERIDIFIKKLRKEEVFFDKFPIREKGKITLLNQEDIVYAESQGKKVVLYTDKQEYVTNYTLNELEARLDRNTFFRVHQAYIVNLNRVREIVAFGEGSYVINLDRPDKQIMLSRARAKVLRKRLGV